MKPFLNKFLNIFHFRRQTAFFAVLGAVFIIGLFVYPFATHAAGVADYVAQALAGLFGIVFQYVLAPILTLILSALTGVAQYNKIITQPTIISTWGVVRDIVNMFFIFAILLIAFSTILRIHQYEAKQLLPKLVLYAVLVNFSLTICGLFIDLAQVFTLTFVNAFADGAVNNFVTITKILDYNTLKLDGSGTMASLGMVLGGYILGLILMVITIVTIGAMLLILLVRIVYLWILSILSPFAFVLPIIPGGQSYAGQWWSMFSKQVITGPLLAFFIWLSLTVLANQGSIANDILNASVLNTNGAAVSTTGTVSGGSTASSPDFLINYIIAICMMFVGLMLTSQMGGAAGRIAGGASNWMQRSGTGLLTGRLGPTPMRWARERYGSWRGQRESIRKEQVQRFGQGMSALQDKAIGGRLQQLIGLPGNYAMRLGKWGAQKATYKVGKNAPSGSRRERWTNKVFSAADKMEWKPGELTRKRAMERVNIYEDNKKSKDQETYQKAGRLSNKDETELRALKDRPDVSRREEAAIIDILNSKYALKKSDLAAINRTRLFLGDTVVRQKFDDLLKKTDLEVAFLSKIYRKTDVETGKEEINIDRFRSDLNQSKIDSSAITNKMFNEMDDQLIRKGAKKGAFMEQWIDEMGSAKEIKNGIGSLSRNVIDEQIKYVTTSHLTEEKALAVGEGSNHWEYIFNRGDDNKFDEKMADEFFSNAQNKDLFVRGHGAKFKNKKLVKFLHRYWPKYEFTGSQWAKMYEDTQARDSIKEIAPDLLAEINGKEGSYNLDYNKDNGYGYGMNRLRNTLMQFCKSDTYDYTDEKGKKKKMEIYDLHHDNLEIREAAKKAFIDQVKQGRIIAEKMENANVWADEAKETGDNEELLEVLAAFNSDGIAKLSFESRKRGKKVIEYMLKHYEGYKATTDRLLSNNALVHMMSETTEEGKTLRQLYDEEKAKFEKKIKAEKESEEGAEKAKKEAKEKKKKEEESKPPPTSGGSSPFGV